MHFFIESLNSINLSFLFFLVGELFMFYTVFYIILAVLFAICMQGLMWSIDEKVPKWTLGESRIGESPGLGFRPMPSNISQGSLIWFNNKNITSIKDYIQLVDKFLMRKLF